MYLCATYKNIYDQWIHKNYLNLVEDHLYRRFKRKVHFFLRKVMSNIVISILSTKR